MYYILRFLTISAAVALLVPQPAAMAQNLSMGIVAGGALTDAFQTQMFPVSFPVMPDLSAARLGHRFSSSKDYIVGGALEMRFDPHWSLEVDVVFRQLHMTSAGILPDGSLTSVSPSPVVTWEFPMLAKYYFQMWNMNPFVEAGPSFRTAGNLNGTNPSHFGTTAGLGIEMHWGHLKIAPGVRYTHWASDKTYKGVAAQTAPNQVELLVGFSRAAESNWRPLGRRISLGVILGTNVTGDFRSTAQPGLAFDQTPVTNINSSGPRSLIAGPAVEVRLFRRISAEVDAVYHPINSVGEVIDADGVRRRRGTGSYITWEFPVLAKYRFSVRRLGPFIAVGPSFRRPQSLTDAPMYGIATAAGVEFQLRQLKIAPAARYTHWGLDKPGPTEGARRDQFGFVIGFSF